jgi:cobalt-zinc-cadmium efflux system protein
MSTEHTHTHNHTHGMARQSLRAAFFLSMLILLASVVGGILSHSLALLSDAGHTLTDLFALGLAWFAAGQAERPSDERKTYGYHRVGILVALLNAVLLILIAIVITWEAVQRFQHPTPIDPIVMFIAAGVSIAINLFIGFGLHKETHDLNVRAAALHVFGDVGASVGVILAGIIVLITGWLFIDPLLSIGIAIFIAFGAWGIVRETTDILLEAVPRDISLNSLVKDIRAVRGVNDVHDLHVWRIASGMSTLSCHVSISDLAPEENARILSEISTTLQTRYHISHATVQCECKDHVQACCQDESLYCRLETTGHEPETHDDDLPVVSLQSEAGHHHH